MNRVWVYQFIENKREEPISDTRECPQSTVENQPLFPLTSCQGKIERDVNAQIWRIKLHWPPTVWNLFWILTGNFFIVRSYVKIFNVMIYGYLKRPNLLEKTLSNSKLTLWPNFFVIGFNPRIPLIRLVLKNQKCEKKYLTTQLLIVDSLITGGKKCI